jgi:hypothetical protein
MARALTNGRTGGFASPSATQPNLFSNVVGPKPYPRKRPPRPYRDASLIVALPAGPGVYQVATADTALSIGGETVAAAVARATTDTALTVAETSLAAKVARATADTALTVATSSLVPVYLANKAIADTALAVGETLTQTRLAPRTLTDAVLTQSDTVAARVATALSDTALAPFETIAVKAARPVADTALTVAVVSLGVRGPASLIADTALTVGIALTVKVAYPPSDSNALQITDALTASSARPVADTAFTIGDSIAASVAHGAVSRSVADTALTVAETVAALIARTLTVGGGLAPSDSLAPGAALAPGASAARIVTDSLTGVTTRVRAIAQALPALTDTLTRKALHLFSDAALVVSDVIGRLGAVRPLSDRILAGSDISPSNALAPSNTLAPSGGVSDSVAVQAFRPRQSAAQALTLTDAIAAAPSRRLASLALQITEDLAVEGEFRPNIRGQVSVTDGPTVTLTLDGRQVGTVYVADTQAATLATVLSEPADVTIQEESGDSLTLTEAL